MVTSRHVKFALAFVLAFASAFAMQYDFGALMRTNTDPSMMDFEATSGYPANITPFVSCTDGSSQEWTVIQWMRLAATNGVAISILSRGTVKCLASTKQGLATKEGGHPVFTNLLAGVSDDNTPLPLSGGAWAGQILPPASSYPCAGFWTNETERANAISQFRYGCYVVNIKTDTPLTLTVGGTEKSVSASPDKQIFNLSASSEDRGVSVVASSASATVYLGMAENPMIEFFGHTMQHSDRFQSVNGDPTLGFAGLAEEWTMFVFRAKVLPSGSVTNRIDAFVWDRDYFTAFDSSDNAGVFTPKVGPVSSFEREARISASISSMGGMEDKRLERYGTRFYYRWVEDSALSRIRDKDVIEMRKKGVVFPTR